MSSTNLTKNLKLSQFVASDKPSWLGDVNGDNKKIDDGYGVLAGEISKANDTASSAKSQSDANTQTLTNVNSELEDYGNRITALEAGGGTEQLEQRVNTLSTDVETLQTRADTFEEDITQNGTDITTLKGKVATIEQKVKTNADNITSLQTETSGFSASIQDLTSRIANVNQIAVTANNTANSAKSTADIANANAQNALSKTNELAETVSTYGELSINLASSSFTAEKLSYIITNKTIHFLPCFINTYDIRDANVAKVVGTIDISSVAAGISTILAGIGESYNVTSYQKSDKFKTYFSATGLSLTINMAPYKQIQYSDQNVNLSLPDIVFE